MSDPIPLHEQGQHQLADRLHAAYETALHEFYETGSEAAHSDLLRTFAALGMLTRFPSTWRKPR